MQYAHLTEEVRHHTRRRLEVLGADADAEMVETILIRDGYFCGRRFECDGFTAVWFVEENELKIHDRDGRVHAAVAIDDLVQHRRRHAA
ncbi:MAG: hypothetical protein KY475_16255 [Planctomycetes bacterium]|nr:hypothetical protein [Planctomycetota bacterium]